MPYAWALPAGMGLAAGAETVAPFVPGVLLGTLLTLLLTQAPLPARRPRPLTPRHPRSELARDLDRRARRIRRGEAD